MRNVLATQIVATMILIVFTAMVTHAQATKTATPTFAQATTRVPITNLLVITINTGGIAMILAAITVCSASLTTVIMKPNLAKICLQVATIIHKVGIAMDISVSKILIAIHLIALRMFALTTQLIVMTK
jgi:hypothetical protein